MRLTLTSLALLLCACSGHATVHATALPSVSRSTSLGYVYVADPSTDKLYVYPAGVNNPTPTRSVTLPDRPHAVVVDSSGNVFVSSTESSEVEVYNSGATTLLYTLTAGLNHPQALALDSSDNLYAANVNAGTVTQYLAGQTTVNATFTPSASPLGGIVVDSAGVLYVDETGGVVEACSPTCATLTGVGGSAAGGLAFTGSKIAVAGGATVNYFTAGTWASAGSSNYFGSTSGIIRFLTSDAGGTLYIPFVPTGLGTAKVLIVPTGTSAILTITNGLHQPYGAATGP